MPRFMSSLPMAALIVVLAGCGSSPSDSATPSTPAVTAADASTASTGSAAAGVASDAGFAQLYQGGSAIAWLHHPAHADAIFDGVMADPVAGAPADGPGAPASQSLVVVDASTLAATNGQTATGTFTFVSDQLAPDGTTPLPASWWHAKLSFDAQATPFTVTNDDGGTASINAGEMDLYIKDVTTLTTTSPPRTGNWTRQADIYSVIPASNALHVQITPSSGTARTSVIAGIRHARQNITRSNDGTTATRVDVHTVTGDASDLVTAIPTVASLLQVGSGPVLVDGAGTSHLYTAWNHHVTLADQTTHTWIWNRWATFTITKTKPTGTALWTSPQISDSGQSVYITRDGTQYGPFNRAQLQNHFNLVMDLTKAGQSL